MRIAFPYALNIGTDIIGHSRLLRPSRASKAINLTKLATRFLHPTEITELDKRFPQWQAYPTTSDHQQLKKLTTWLAGRWAAKEAAKKAWGAHLISFRDLRVESKLNGEVDIICQSFEKAGEVDSISRQKDSNLEQVGKLSISHDGDYAVATVIAAPLHPDIVATLQARKVIIP